MKKLLLTLILLSSISVTAHAQRRHTQLSATAIAANNKVMPGITVSQVLRNKWLYSSMNSTIFLNDRATELSASGDVGARIPFAESTTMEIGVGITGIYFDDYRAVDPTLNISMIRTLNKNRETVARLSVLKEGDNVFYFGIRF